MLLISSVTMRSNLPVAGVLLQAGLSFAKPYLYAKNGMVYNVLPREGALEENEAAVEARGMSLEQANVADSTYSPTLLVPH